MFLANAKPRFLLFKWVRDNYKEVSLSRCSRGKFVSAVLHFPVISSLGSSNLVITMTVAIFLFFLDFILFCGARD
jgi:hypothetical protein